MITAAATPSTVLDEDLLARCAERAADYDAENRFFAEDLTELAAAGYLLLTVPVERGGLGADLPTACLEQRRLARRAPATALGLCMHHYWGGLAADLLRAGDRSLTWLLDQIVDGKLFAVGRGERGSDMPLVAPLTRAEPVEGGYRFTGHKIFTSMSPAWDWLAIEGLDSSDPGAPKVVHAFLPREEAGWSVIETWNTMGMRATSSHDTLLEGAFVPDRYVARVVPPGWGGMDAFVLGIKAWGETLIASVYVGIAERAYELAVAGVGRRTSTTLAGRTMAHNPMVVHTVAEMAIELQCIVAVMDRVAADWSQGVAHGTAWPARLAAARCRAVTGAVRVVDMALELSGGGGMFRGNELERLYRDVRCGPFHPPNPTLAHELIGLTELGLLDEKPSWRTE